MEAFLAPAHLSPERRAEALRSILRGTRDADVVLYESALLGPPDGFAMDLDTPDACVREVLAAREDLMLPLARLFYPFRLRASQKIVQVDRQGERSVLSGDGVAGCGAVAVLDSLGGGRIQFPMRCF
ncbi:MAG: hypothetical protein WDO18_18505 [Acidobacteriota bacterium]